MPPKTKKKGKTFVVRLTYRYHTLVEVEARTAQEAFDRAEEKPGECVGDHMLIGSEIIGVRDDD